MADAAEDTDGDDAPEQEEPVRKCSRKKTPPPPASHRSKLAPPAAGQGKPQMKAALKIPPVMQPSQPHWYRCPACNKSTFQTAGELKSHYPACRAVHLAKLSKIVKLAKKGTASMQCPSSGSQSTMQPPPSTTLTTTTTSTQTKSMRKSKKDKDKGGKNN